MILTLLLILLFSLLLPQTFPTLLNLRSILSDKSLIALLSLAAMIPMMTGKIDLTVGYGIVLWHILAITLQPPRPALAGSRRLVVLAGAACRLVQRHARRGRAHRQLHRHPGHRHGDLCGGALVHRRPADHRQPAARLSSW